MISLWHRHVFTYKLRLLAAWVRLYVRELREVRGVEVQAPRQPLHQLRALVGGEGPGGGGARKRRESK